MNVQAAKLSNNPHVHQQNRFFKINAFIHTIKVLPLSNDNEQSVDTQHSMHESQKHDMEQRESDIIHCITKIPLIQSSR